MKNKNGFTFVEIMIAIVVFSIGVVAVLGLVTTNLKAMDRNDLKLQATVLAKEGLELVYNIRDSNLEREFPRNCIMNQAVYGKNSSELSSWMDSSSRGEADRQEGLRLLCPQEFAVGSGLRVSYSTDQYTKVESIATTSDFDTNYSGNKLYLHTGDGGLFRYSHENGGEETYFARFITFTGLIENSQRVDTNKILKIESHVLWKKGGLTGEVILESFIGNY